jgi:hypothetical protein
MLFATSFIDYMCYALFFVCFIIVVLVKMTASSPLMQKGALHLILSFLKK